MSVYIDLVFFVNFIFDAEILYILLKIYSKKIVLWRILPASLMGGIQGTLFFIPYFRVLSVSPIGILTPIIYVFIVLYPCSIKECMAGYLIFLFISFTYSGLMNLFGINVLMGTLLILPVFLSIQMLKRRIAVKRNKVKIFYNGKCIEKEGIYDSGNKTFYFGTPVIYGSKSVFKGIFGSDFEKNNIWTAAKKNDICLIPYKTIDKSGLALGIRLDKAVINGKEYKNIVLGLFENVLEDEIILNGIMM